MEDDDEFGDLYTDVLRPFSSSLSSAPPSQPPPSLHRPIDLNLNEDDQNDADDEILAVGNNSDDNDNVEISNNNNYNNLAGSVGVSRVLSSSLDIKLQKYPHESSNNDKDINFDIEEEQGDNSVPLIPGLAVSADADGGSFPLKEAAATADMPGGVGVGGVDWGDEDSDSEDDLQIVLNDGPMGMERGGGGMMGDGADDDEDDDDPLVIVGDGNAGQPMMEDPDWGPAGEDAAAAGTGAEGERKEGGGETAGKGGVAPKIGYSNQVYHHPFHSQFKYVRPGAAPMPGATTAGPGAAPGQVRPPINMAGRGRGDWRPAGMKNGPALQKGYFGMPWGNMAGRGSGGGLEFTLPSHKTIFDVDIDSFEEKPWKYPGVDVSDFFNFGMDEDKWKEYCKQLEQHRLETTMQSKIRVYESGRADQEYDPDLPPELALAAGMHDVSGDNSNIGKSDVGQNDLAKGPARMRPPLPTGRAIQVEGGSGERLPSIDTRPPRQRDNDAIIEIVLQDSLEDDSSAGNGVLGGANDDLPRDDSRESYGQENDMEQMETDYYNDGFQKGRRRAPHVTSGRNSILDGDQRPPFSPEAFDDDERRGQERTVDKSPDSTPSRVTLDKRSLDNADEDSIGSMDGKHSPFLSSSSALKDAKKLSPEGKDVAITGEHSSGIERDEMTDNVETTNNSMKNGDTHHSVKKQKLNSNSELSTLQELDDREDSKAARSSENSKARSGSSKDYPTWQDGVEDEVVQDGRVRHKGSIRRHVEDNEPNFRRRERDSRQEIERTYMVKKGREGSHPHRDLDPSSAHHPHMRNEGYDRRKERENPDGAWLRREEDPLSRKNKIGDTRKRERGEEMASRHRSKIREGERSDKEEHLHSRKQLDNGSFRFPYDKDGGSRHREREDNLKIRYDMADDYHSKRRKDEEYVRRDHAVKEEILHGHSRRRRDRDDMLDPRKRDDQQRVRDGLDDYHSVRHKDEVWLQRERVERQREREREEFYRLKPPHEENFSKREKEEGRGASRTGRGVDDKAWMNHPRVKDEHRGSEKDYQLKDAVRSSEQLKRRDRADDEGYSHHRARDDVYGQSNQLSNEERRSRQERSSVRIDRVVDAPDNQRAHERKHKDSTRKSKELEGGDHSSLGPSRRNQEDQSVHSSGMGLKVSAEQGNGQNDIAIRRSSSKRHKEDASSDEEQQDSRRGRSKLERWTSHKERDYSINSKSSASLKFKEIGSLEANKLSEEQSKKLQVVEKPEEKDAVDVENKDSDTKQVEDRHSDTFEKLKKRSERFKLPMPSEKDAVAVKRIESEAPLSAKTEAPADLEIKPERPARKRRWISS